ncbi:MAG: hypothetical protein COU08_03660 [Candidatus Harrisonbacteria bacterium CG10_big_fil_rev_8_21_14_0_10_42_17]|uniref:Uncharacterized protein n=1 Tax=Candidatus Harrisonbacteria bacterium CG10_big_fil_rev_8_21_14_0_10_42_17 TaxID=1974584 RepID=A0A2M6WHE2_9BACT|nr:MAG: hypothetical protein COU08_03660 [Candidatus Harrisonbacteria bacterium CG10_big_fil_rev_8_21_14_0_10_42_17]
MEIIVTKQSEDETHYVFVVEVKDEEHSTRHTIFEDKGYCEKIGGGITPEALVKKSFEFLLEREPQEAILRQFNLKEIKDFFPEYEREISDFSSK